MKWLKVVGVLVVVGVVGGGFMYLWKGVNAEREALKQVIKRQEEQLKEKEQRVQELESQLEVLRKEQVLKEKKIAGLKRKRQNIKPPQNEGELVDRLKKLGYEDVRVK